MIIEQQFLGYQEGTSDKVYHVQLLSVGNGYKVAFQYGRRGKSLTYGTKTEEPVNSKWAAEDLYFSLINSKKKKGYRPIKVDEEYQQKLEFMIALSY